MKKRVTTRKTVRRRPKLELNKVTASYQLKKNPPATQIYPASSGVVIQGMKKGPGHPCDAACKAAGHRYRHLFKQPVEIIGLADGNVLLRPKKR